MIRYSVTKPGNKVRWKLKDMQTDKSLSHGPGEGEAANILKWPI